MATPTPRRLSISDGMLLLAVVTVGIVGARSVLALQQLPPSWWGVSALQGSVWFVAVASLALAPMRLRRPRPRPARLWRQPGWLATTASPLAFGFCAAQQLLKVSPGLFESSGMPPGLYVRRSFLETTYRLPYEAACAVAVVWSLAAVSGRWKPERSWIDRLGRLVGWYWISFPLLDWGVILIAMR